MRKGILLVALLFLLSIFTSGCAIKISTNRGGLNGGIFKSEDKGKTWQQKVAVLATQGQLKTIARVNVTTLIFAPQDSQTIYLGTQASGAYVSYDGAESWQKILSSKQPINAIAVDPLNSNIVYIALERKILKSIDCCHHFKTTYLEIRPPHVITALAINPYDTRIIYAGTAGGDLFKSLDYGHSWQAVYSFKHYITRILIHPKTLELCI